MPKFGFPLLPGFLGDRGDQEVGDIVARNVRYRVRTPRPTVAEAEQKDDRAPPPGPAAAVSSRAATSKSAP